MKTFLLSAAVVAMAATSPAFAAPRSGGDGVGTYYISGSATNFCQLGQIGENSVGNTRNAEVDYTSANSDGFSGGTSDAKINITQLQDENDHADAWRAVINMRRSVCNSAYTVTATSLNGGLAYQGTENGNSDFTKKLAYTVSAEFDGHGGNPREARALQNGGTLATSNRASAGDFKLVFDGNADNSQYLLAGDYTDRVVVELTPNLGDAA